MKFYFLILLILLKLPVTAQTYLSDNFKIGDCLEIFGTDSIKVYFNCAGAVTDKQCALYYRVGKIHPEIINVEGEFYDYNMKNKLFLKATMRNNNLEGFAQYYHENGNIREEGFYENNARLGKWTFYHPNGKIQKMYEYAAEGEPIVSEAYASNGIAMVVNGTGEFKTEFSQDMECYTFVASGQLLNGKKHGVWAFSNPKAELPIANETYQEGNFVKGTSYNYEYTHNPKIILTKFNANEHLSLLDNGPCMEGISSRWKYDNDYIENSFYPQLQKKLSKYKDPVKNQWLAVGITISKKDKLETVNVASSINDIKLEKFVQSLISKMKVWQSAVVNASKIESNIFFSILVDNNQIILPADYIIRNEK